MIFFFECSVIMSVFWLYLVRKCLVSSLTLKLFKWAYHIIKKFFYPLCKRRVHLCLPPTFQINDSTIGIKSQKKKDSHRYNFENFIKN